MLWSACLALAVLALLPTPGRAADETTHGGPHKAKPDKQTASSSQAVAAPRVTERFTDKGMTVNPIAIDFDPKGNVYVVEAWRAGISVIDNRNRGLRQSNGVINDLQKKSVEDRLKQIEMLEAGGFYPKGTFTKAADKIRFLQDTDGDGKADQSSIFADGFDDKLDGIAAGVLWHNGKVYLTNIPHVWLLEDKDGDGDADKTTAGERTSLSYGWGIRWAFYGHDMHGLIKGPDGRIYFSIGDRGFNVTNQEGKQLYSPNRGAVLRMWPDGSGLEVFHDGLRNPQELAFDNYGNLFTGDNNGDYRKGGERARFVHVTEGGHSGWDQDVQSLSDRGPWDREHMWRPRKPNDDVGQPAWMTHPIANVGRGPSGIAHYPGTGDVFAMNGSFLMCDYPAGVRHVRVEPDGASFKVVQDDRFKTTGDTITDIAWGYDGRLYLADWGGGWKPNPNGHLVTMVNKAAHKEQAAVLAEVNELFANGFDKLEDKQLIDLLGHRDQRVRLHAQWQAASRPLEDRLYAVLSRPDASVLERLHALWALAQRMRSDQANKQTPAYLSSALKDTSPHVVSNAAKMMGELGLPLPPSLLDHPNPGVRYQAAIAMGKTGGIQAIDALLDLLSRNKNEDPAIRHAASYGLSLIGESRAIHRRAKTRDQPARLGAVIALRRLKSPLLAEYLGDEDLRVAAEAVRGVYDMRVMEVFPALARMLDGLAQDRMIEPIMKRVIEANIRLNGDEHVKRLAEFASNGQAPEQWRQYVLLELGRWADERGREGVWGAWWPRGKQPAKPAIDAITAVLPRILKNGSERVQELARTPLLVRESVQTLQKVTRDPGESAGLRKVAMKVLAGKDKQAGTQAAIAVVSGADEPSGLKIAARQLLTSLDMPAAIQSYLTAAENAPLTERQDAVRRLSQLNAKQAYPLLEKLGQALKQGELPAGLRLDVYEAIQTNRNLPLTVRSLVSDYRQANQIEDEKPFIRDALLTGGSASNGKQLFYEHPAAQCQRCHSIGGGQTPGDAAAGPDLAGIAMRHTPGYLYTAIARPSADFAQGYPRKELSDMPVMTDKLKPSELRDILAFLVTLKQAPKTAGAGKAAGPTIINPAKGLNHAIWLPGILLGILAALGVLFVMTMLGGKRVEV